MATFHILNDLKAFKTGKKSFDNNPLVGTPGVYCVTVNETGKVYVGSTATLPKRASSHASNLKRDCHGNSNLQAAYNENPEIEIVFKRTASFDEAIALEQQLVNEFKDTGYLCNVGTADVTNPLKGIPHTEEWKRRNSEILTGSRRSEATKARITAGQKAFYQTDRGLESLKTNSKEVTVAGVTYPSISAAVRETGISRYQFHEGQLAQTPIRTPRRSSPILRP
jgi:predicted GIY-YIG superfamily endonuclease